MSAAAGTEKNYPLLPGANLWAGARIGLLGGSFDPAHEGHLHLSREALKRLALDQVWWLVSPGNPLKNTDALPSVERRVAAAKRVASHPRIQVSNIEEQLGTRYTIDTLTALQRAAPAVRFVWLMGADNLAELPAWKSWEEIMRCLPVAVFDRPGYSIQALNGVAARKFADARLPAGRATALADAQPPAWMFVPCTRHAASATALRQAQGQ
jgi:nicotinate-nucleotide adenylyltransferase